MIAKLQLHVAVTAYESSAGSIKQEEKPEKKMRYVYAWSTFFLEIASHVL